MTFLVGRGIADITGEPAGCGMLGYGKAEQRTEGIHQRQRSRAFVIDDGQRRVLLVIAELPLPMQSVTDEVLRRLAEQYQDTYTGENTLITTTHTHAGPGGYCGHLLYNLTTNGFHPLTFAAIVDGIVESVTLAHDDLAPAELTLNRGELLDASCNRSPSAFARNPEQDRAFFPHQVDPQTTLVRIDRGGRPAAVINFFATHGTSMTNLNTLISGDNKGYAAYHWERLVEGADYLGGQPDFITAFAQTNAGDMSPNLGHRLGRGPTEDEVENTRIIGLRQFEAAAKLLDGGEPIGAGVDSRLTYVDLGRVDVRPEFTPDGLPHRTSPPVFAAAAIAGTDEGEGFRGFHQGRNPFWDAMSKAYYRLSPRLRETHAPKGIVAPGSVLNRMTPFVQERVPVQLFRIGRLHLIAIPAEVTIVAGLRLRRQVAAIVGADLADVLVVGYSNAYVHYVTTPEEYEDQRYEGGSTLFGRWELPALQQIVAGLAEAMRDGRPAETGPRPGRLTTRSWLRPLPADAGAFGSVVRQPEPEYRAGETVTTVFASANPNNDLRRNATYLEVQREAAAGWVRIADDGDWSTTFRWQPGDGGQSRATITWATPNDAEPGRYRIVHHGAARSAGGGLAPFTAETREFVLR